MENKLSVGAYFYPLSRMDRASRGAVGALVPAQATDEVKLSTTAPRLFEDHDQPRQYAIPQGNTATLTWDDAGGHDVIPQLALAQAYGLSHFIFNSYTGVRDAQFTRELSEARRVASNARLLGAFGLKYARMEVLESPRTVLPIPLAQAHESSATMQRPLEAKRQYDITPASARAIIADCQPDWNKDHYLKVAGYRPYLSVLMPYFQANLDSNAQYDIMARFMETLHTGAVESGWFPYLVGVMRDPRDVELWARIGVDAITQYCHLPDMGPGAAPVQEYRKAAANRLLDWQDFARQAARRCIPFIPSPAVGWDASPRGEAGYTVSETLRAPYTPLISGARAEDFEHILREAIAYTESMPESQRILTVFAWNEVSEGAALLPRLRGDKLDFSYLEAIQRVLKEARLKGL